MTDVAVPEEPDGDVVLAEPVRTRLLQLASEVLGRLPAEDVPASLRAVARFTPGKRARLGGVAITAALDADADFRARVADAVEQSSPQLVESLREHASTAASDPIDTAVVAYLIRPGGWTVAVADATARWSGERADVQAAAAERDQLRAEIAQLRAELKDGPSRLRAAASEASAQATAEAAQTRRTLRVRAAELRTAQVERDAAVAALAEARREAAGLAGTHDAEVRRLRGRIGELERSAESARRGARTDREVDDARLRMLVETLAGAAAGIRRELSLPPGTLRPADSVESGRGADGGRGAADPAELDRLLEMPHVHLIVDGYNVTKTGYGELTLADQRTRLLATMAALHARSAPEITVAFDGAARPPSLPRTPRGVRVLFSAADEIADDLIRRLVAAEPPGRPVVVVTSDQQIVTDVRRDGAWTVPSAVLLARLG